jgi:hypothetical protein
VAAELVQPTTHVSPATNEVALMFHCVNSTPSPKFGTGFALTLIHRLLIKLRHRNDLFDRKMMSNFAANYRGAMEGHVMNAVSYNAISLVIGALLFVPLSPSTTRADDDDDWEDRWEEYDDDWDDNDDDRWGRRRWHQHPAYGYREYHSGPRYQRYYRGPVHHHDYYPERRVYRYYEPYPRYYRYGGRVHAGPIDVFYGRHGAVRLGPIQVYW